LDLHARGNPPGVAPVRLIALLVAAVALAAAGCGGEAETVTVTETETVTVPPEGADDRAFQLAEDVCDALPLQLVAPFLGADARNQETVAEALAQRVRPELREAARDGCLESLGTEDATP
jgi:hypothetical protein